MKPIIEIPTATRSFTFTEGLQFLDIQCKHKKYHALWIEAPYHWNACNPNTLEIMEFCEGDITITKHKTTNAYINGLFWLKMWWRQTLGTDRSDRILTPYGEKLGLLQSN